MKKINTFVILLCFILLLTGCSNFRMAASIDDLISPVSPSGDNAGVQSALDEYCKSGYSIKIPASGSYTTSFILKDIDNDSVNEAIAFYEPSNKMGTVSMSVLKKSDDKWTVFENIESAATDVNSVDFCDLNNDGLEEIIVCWSVVSKTAGFKLNVYRLTTDNNGQYLIKNVSDSVTASDFICVDMNSDGVKELMIFANGVSSEYPKAELYSYTDNKKKLLGRTKLDSTITSFENISYGETDEGMSVYADAVRSDGSSMVTEFIYWSDYYNSIVSPFYSYSTSRTSETSRNSMIVCRDIDSDGIIEIPTDADFSKLPSGIEAQSWKIYKNTVLTHKCYSFSCKRDGYIIVVPDDIFKEISVEYDNDLRLFKVIDKKENLTVFEILTVVKTSYNSEDSKYSGYEKILDDSGFVYLSKINPKSSIKIDTKTLKDMVKPY
ncbi:MAG: hypothetical protein ACI4V4_06415 [Eubacterium sp.]